MKQLLPRRPPALLLLSLLRHTPLQAEKLTELLSGILPDTLRQRAEELIVMTWDRASGIRTGLSGVTALWSASRGIYGVQKGLNAIYGVPEDRGWLRTRLISAVYTFAFLLMLILTLALHMFGTALLDLLEGMTGPGIPLMMKLIDLRFVLLMILQTGFFAVMFMVLPNRRNGFLESFPGALLAAGGWLIFSGLYSWYVEHFARLRDVFGSVYAVALSMLWLYCCMSIVFYAGGLNAVLAGRKQG